MHVTVLGALSPNTCLEAWVSGDFPILTLNQDKADRLYITFLLSRPQMWEPLHNVAVGTASRRRLQIPEILEILIPLPTLPEQREIARVLSVVDRKIEAEEGRKRQRPSPTQRTPGLSKASP